MTLDSPALDVMTDLTQGQGGDRAPRSDLREAEQTMIYQGVRMLFVVTDMPSIEGLITTTDLRGEKPMRVVHERQVRYDELSVADVMTELSMLDAIDFDRLKGNVSNVIATLKIGRNHLLIVEGDAADAAAHQGRDFTLADRAAAGHHHRHHADRQHLRGNRAGAGLKELRRTRSSGPGSRREGPLGLVRGHHAHRHAEALDAVAEVEVQPAGDTLRQGRDDDLVELLALERLPYRLVRVGGADDSLHVRARRPRRAAGSRTRA